MTDPITLFCLVDGKPFKNAFEVEIQKGKSIYALKELIISEGPSSLKDLRTSDLNLWKVSIPNGDEKGLQDFELKGKFLPPVWEIGKAFAEEPQDEHIHIIIKLSGGEQVVTQTVSQQLLEESNRTRGEIAQLQGEIDQLQGEIQGIVEKFKPPFHFFELIVRPKTKTTISWGVDIDTATLGMLSTRICQAYPEYKDSALLFIFKRSDGQTHTPQTNEELQKLLRSLIARNEMRVKLSVTTPAKYFSDWTLGQVLLLYEIGVSDLSHFPRFECNCKSIDNNHILPALVETLKGFLLTTPLIDSTEAAKSSYVHSFLNAAILDFVSESHSQFAIKPKPYIEGLNGKGPVDYAIEIADSDWVVGVTEVKREDFKTGVAQNLVQIESALLLQKRKRKRKASVEADEISAEAARVRVEEPTTRCFGIVTDARDWRFLECTYDKSGRPKFRLSHVYSVTYNGKPTMQEDVKEILEVIKWLLIEATTAASAATPTSRKKSRNESS